MFNIEYRISQESDSKFIGEMGYYKMICNSNYYGDIFPKELEDVMGTEYLYDFMRDMLMVVNELKIKKYVALNNIESYNLWVEFRRQEKNVLISLVYADKPDGTLNIEFELLNKNYDEKLWKEEKFDYNDFKNKVLLVVKEYVRDVQSKNVSQSIKEIEILTCMIKELEV